MAVISIKYTGKDIDIKYESVIITRRTGEEYIFNSGDFVKDWFSAKKKYINIAYDELYLLQSSSVDNFIMDGAKYDSAWLMYGPDGETPHLVYQSEEADGGWEIFVNPGTTPTWEEHKKQCKN